MRERRPDATGDRVIAKRPRAKRTALGPYALGALQPARVFEPKEPAEVAATLRAAAAAR